MVHEVKQQRWEFRRTYNDIDSSSGESKSSSEAAHKKHKLVSSLISLENDEAIGNSRVRQTGTCSPRTEDQIMLQKGKRVHRRRKKGNWTDKDMERDSHKIVSREKGKTGVYDPAALDELKILMESVLEDLKVKRKNLLSWMRKEMQKLVVDDAAPRSRRREGSSRGKNVQVQHGENVEENTISKKNVQVHNKRKFEESMLIQHQNNFETNVLVQHKSNSEQNVFAQDHNNFKKTDQVTHQHNFGEDYGSNLGSGVKAQQCDIGSSVRRNKSNTEAGYDNCYHAKPIFQSCSTEKNVPVQHQMNYLSGTRAQTFSYRSLESPFIGKKTAQSNNCHPSIEHRVDCVQEIGSKTSSDREKGRRFGVSIESNFSSNVSSQVDSSMYLTLPTVLTTPCGENHMLSTSSSNYIQTPLDRNKLDVNPGIANSMLKVNCHDGNLWGMLQEERNGSAQMRSRTVSCFDKQSIPSSSIGTEFPVPLHQGMDTGVSIPSQVSFGYLPWEVNNITGLRMDEGAPRFSGGSYAISEDYLANSIYSHSISKAHGRVKAFRNQ